MAGSRRTFSYRLLPAGEDVGKTAARARKILAWACDGDNRIECHGVTGEAVGVVTMNLTIVNRDQWACRQLAQNILNYVTWGLANPMELDLTSDRQPVHMNRGYGHGRTKRYNEPRPKVSPEPGPGTND